MTDQDFQIPAPLRDPRGWKRRRSSLEIRIAMLEASLKPIKPTNLMYDTNQSWGPLRKNHIPALIGAGLLEWVSVPWADRRTEGGKVLRTTPSGAKVLKLVRELQKAIGKAEEEAE